MCSLHLEKTKMGTGGIQFPRWQCRVLFPVMQLSNNTNRLIHSVKYLRPWEKFSTGMSILLDSLDHIFHLQGLHARTTQLPRIAFLSYKMNHKKSLAFEVYGLCWAAFIATLGSIQPTGYELDIPDWHLRAWACQPVLSDHATFPMFASKTLTEETRTSLRGSAFLP